MSDYTPFAGLYKLAPGEPISLNNYEFYENETIIDNMFNAFVTHRHDNHPAVLPFASAAIPSASAAGGSLAAGETWYIGITALDQFGGETTAKISSAIIPGSATDPTIGPTPSVSGTGSLNLGTYRYAYTYIDSQGESLISPQANVTVPQNGRVLITLPTSSQSKMIYRAFGYGDFHKVASALGTASSIIDDGSLCVSCDQQPPDENTLALSGSIRIARGAVPASAVSWRVYVSEEPDLPTPAALYAYSASALRDIPSAASSVMFTSPQQIRFGNPPAVSRTIPGASYIYAQDVFYNGSSGWLASGNVESALDFVGDHYVYKIYASSTVSGAGSASAVHGPLIQLVSEGGVNIRPTAFEASGIFFSADRMQIGYTESGTGILHQEKRDHTWLFGEGLTASATQAYTSNHYEVRVGLTPQRIYAVGSASPFRTFGTAYDRVFYVGSGIWGASTQVAYLPYAPSAGFSITLKTIASGLASGYWQVRASGSDLVETVSSAWASARMLQHLESFEFVYFPQSMTGTVGQWFIK